MPVSVTNSQLIYDSLKACDIRLMSALPETWLVHLIRMADEDPEVQLVRLAKEEEGVGISAGAHLAGVKSALLMQNHGFLQSVNGIVGVSRLYRIPLRLATDTIGSPTMRLVKHMRITMATPPDGGEPDIVAKLAMARMRFLGSPWARRSDTPILGFSGSAGEPHGEVAVSIVSTEDTTDQFGQAGVGARAWMTERFMFRAEYSGYVVFTSRDENEEVEEWKAGFAFFF